MSNAKFYVTDLNDMTLEFPLSLLRMFSFEIRTLLRKSARISDMHVTPSELVFERDKVAQSSSNDLQNIDVDVYNQSDLEQAVSQQV